MRFPNTNKIHRDLNTSFGENAALLEERLKQVDWRFAGKAYAYGLAVFLGTLFSIIVTVKLALVLF